MKVAMIGQKGIPAADGGIERHVEEVATRLAARGHEVIVYCRKWIESRQNKKEKQKLQKIKNLRLVGLFTIHTKHLDTVTHTFLSTLHAIRENPEIYHFHGVGPALFAWLPRLARPRAKVIATFHCLDRKHQKWGAAARLALRLGEWAACRLPHKTIVVSRTLEQYCAEVYGRRSTYIPNGTAERIAAGKNLIKRFGLKPNKYIVQVSRLVRHKGVHLSIAAWNELQISHPELIRGMKLVIVGGGSFTDEYVKELRMLAGNDPSIVFTGLQTGAMLDQLYANALFVAHPSQSEGMPISILEAMSYEKVVIASDIPENLEVIAEHGVPVRAGNAHALCQKMAELLKNKKELAAPGRAAAQFALKNYHWENIADEIELVYRQYLPAPSTQSAPLARF